MGIFTHHKTVIEVFDDMKQVEQAIDGLQNAGFNEEAGDEIHILDQERLEPKATIEARGFQDGPPPGVNLSSAHDPAIVYDELMAPEAGSAFVERSAKESLTELGIGEEEADFYSRHILGGKPLVVVKTAEKRAATAQQILEQVKHTPV